MIQDLFEIQSSVHGYLGPDTQQELVRKVYNNPSIPLEVPLHFPTNVGCGRTQLSDSLAALSNAASSTPARAPPELIHQFIDDGRNPDIYTREFIEQIQLLNREMKGKCEAFASFGAILGAEMTKAIPNLEDDVARILSTGSTESTKNGHGESTGS